MDWNSLLLYILEGVASVAIAGLGSLAVYLINKYIKNEKVKAWATSLAKIVNTAVTSTYQTYVEALKGTDAWTDDAQKEALSKALTACESSLSSDMKTWIQSNFGDVEMYLKELIESEIAKLKASSK